MNFLCYRVTTFSVFSISLSLFFFPKVQKLRCTLYTGTHCMVHKCWLVRKSKKQVISGINSLRHCEKQNTLFFLLRDEHFFFCLSKKCLKSLICTVLEYQTICYYNPKFPNREYVCIFPLPILFCISCACSFPVKVEKILLKDHTNLGFPMWLIFQRTKDLASYFL